MFYVMLGLLAGIVLPIQTGVNKKLQNRVGSALRASTVSFVVGTLVLILATAVMHGRNMIPFARASGSPWWIWMGGVLGAVFLISNLRLYASVGSARTVIFTVTGQILMGLLVDHFGWFNGEIHPLTVQRVLGGVMVFAGMMINTRSTEERAAGQRGRIPWLAIVAGMLIGAVSAAQTAVNAALGQVLQQPVSAALVSFAVGSVVLVAGCLVTGKPSRAEAPAPAAREPWWIWFGGILGVIFVLANLFVAGHIGTGMAVVASLTGMVIGGLVMDQWGLLESPKNPVTIPKLLGLLVMIAGILLVRTA